MLGQEILQEIHIQPGNKITELPFLVGFLLVQQQVLVQEFRWKLNHEVVQVFVIKLQESRAQLEQVYVFLLCQVLIQQVVG